MKVHVYPADLGGCGYYRLIWPAEVLRQRGHDVTVFAPGSQAGLPIAIVKGSSGPRLTLLTKELECDVMVLQRPLDWRWTEAIPQIKATGCRVVADIDDDFASLRGDHHAFWGVHPKTSPEHNWQHLANALSKVDLVTTSTPALADRYAKHGRFAVVPNCVPESYLGLSKGEQDPLVVGWSGTLKTHPGDLNALGPTLPRLRRKHDFDWAVLGDSDGVGRAVGVEPRSLAWAPIAEYAHRMAEFDVGVVPLLQHPFNEAKSWLKGMEFAAVGVPFVASPTSPYRTLHDEGAGVLAAQPKQWEFELRRLLTDDVWRKEVIERGYETASRWTIQANAWRWEQAWLG